MPARRFKVIVCRGPECGDRRGSAALQAAFVSELAARALVGIEPDVTLETQSCFGRCTVGPNVLVREVTAAEPTVRQFATMPGPRGATALYNRVTVDRVTRLIDSHLIEGRVVREFIERPPAAVPVAAARPSDVRAEGGVGGDGAGGAGIKTETDQ